MGEPGKPIIFQQGAPKSASSFCSQLLREITSQNGADQVAASKLVKAKHRGAFVNDLSKIRSVFNKLPELSVIKTHASPSFVSDYLQEGAAIAFVTFRDPLDSVQSLLDHAAASRENGKAEFAEVDTPDEAARIIMLHWSYSMLWLRNPNVYPVFYNDLKRHPLRVVKRMAGIIGVEVDLKKIQRKIRDTNKIRRFNVGKIGRGELLLRNEGGGELERMFDIFYRSEKWINPITILSAETD